MKALNSLLTALTLAFGTLVLPAVADDAVPARHIRGTLSDVGADAVTVKTTRGPVTVRLDGKTKILGVVPTGADEITSGTFIGTANVPMSSSASTRALEVVVFPASMAGVGEGDYPWDLPRGTGHSQMTNGTVAPRRAGGSMMTNGTVMGINNRGSKIITLQYKGGSKQVTIPPGVPIVRVVPGSKALLVPGAHVVAFPAAAGAAATPVLIVGEQGTVPPM